MDPGAVGRLVRYTADVAAIEGHCDDVIQTAAAAAAQICVHANGDWEHKEREQLKHVNKRHHVIGFSANRITTLLSVQLMLICCVANLCLWVSVSLEGE